VQLLAEFPVDLHDGAVLKLWHYRVLAGYRDDPHAHPWHQLAWSPTGVLTVEAADRWWVVPPSIAFWVPATVRHAVGATSDAVLHHLTFYPDADDRLLAAPYDRPLPITMTTLMREVLEHLANPHLSRRSRQSAGEVFIDAMNPAGDAPLELLLPRDSRALRIAEQILNHPGDDRSVEQLGRDCGASRRTVHRYFQTETGLTFAEWRNRARINASLPHLANGTPINVTAQHVGYRNTSAFIASFKRHIGITPGAYQTRQFVPRTPPPARHR
jgi:AraC-like DNA-binding protein/quercetin dioxygenase-like cupin family protein